MRNLAVYRYMLRQFEKNCAAGILAVYNLVNIVVSAFFYMLLPTLLNYAPGIVENGYDAKWLGISYRVQFIYIILLITIIGSGIVVKNLLRPININKWHTIDISLPENRDKVDQLRKKCLKLPRKIYLTQILTPLVTMSLLYSYLIIFKNATPIIAIKTIIVVASLGTVAATITMVVSKKLFRRILKYTYIDQKLEKADGSLITKLFTQILPLFTVAIVFTALIGYSKLIEEKSNLLFEVYRGRLESEFTPADNGKTLAEITRTAKDLKLQSLNDVIFVVGNDGIVTSSGETPSSFFINYMNMLSPSYNNRVYDFIGDRQGVFVEVPTADGIAKVGVEYEVVSPGTIKFFLFGFAGLLIIFVFAIFYFSGSFLDDIKAVAEGLNNILKEKTSKPVEVLSNDEIGELATAFNKIQELERERLEQLKDYQRILLQRERLVSLGEAAGNVAHDINNPMSAVSYGLSTIDDVLKCIRKSNITEEQSELLNLADEALANNITACQRALTIVSSLRNGTRNLDTEFVEDFYLSRIFDDIKSILGYRFKQSGSALKISEFRDVTIRGDASKLYRVVANIIANSLDAYGDKGGQIEVNICPEPNYGLVISIKDYAGGIPEEIRQTVFKKMLTSKSQEGTGIGLYMSKSLITGHYGGDLRFEVDEGKGTTFFICIPFYKENDQNCGGVVNE